MIFVADQRGSGSCWSHHRDIRDLIGARDLYITDIYDVAKTGKPAKPFDRVFHTKDRSQNPVRYQSGTRVSRLVDDDFDFLDSVTDVEVECLRP